jgi:hypothetical protein
MSSKELMSELTRGSCSNRGRAMTKRATEEERGQPHNITTTASVESAPKCRRSGRMNAMDAVRVKILVESKEITQKKAVLSRFDYDATPS